MAKSNYKYTPNSKLTIVIGEIIKNSFSEISIILAISFCLTISAEAQNKNFIVNLSLGVGNSGFKIEDEGADELRRIFYPTGGLQIQKRINSKWAINVYPNVGMSGNRRTLNIPVGNITEVRSTSAFFNLGLHPKYYMNESIYFSFGPEVAYLLWNSGSTFNGEERQSNIKETDAFNRTNLLASSSIGFTKKIGESRNHAPVQIDALWYLEFRVKKGITNILNRNVFGNNASSTIFSLEIVTGISLASKK